MVAAPSRLGCDTRLSQRVQHARAADRCAHEIGAILKVSGSARGG
jgi:hypothetical protein